MKLQTEEKISNNNNKKKNETKDRTNQRSNGRENDRKALWEIKLKKKRKW